VQKCSLATALDPGMQWYFACHCRRPNIANSSNDLLDKDRAEDIFCHIADQNENRHAWMVTLFSGSEKQGNRCGASTVRDTERIPFFSIAPIPDTLWSPRFLKQNAESMRQSRDQELSVEWDAVEDPNLSAIEQAYGMLISFTEPVDNQLDRFCGSATLQVQED
jgi:hypothetical protein